VIRFGEFTVDPERFELRRAGELVHVEPQVFDVLAYLAARPDATVTKEELLDNVWGDRFVSESALTSRIKAARQAVGDDGDRQAVIRTVRGRGYRFVAEVARP
jgi:DNA-binding winged helix-turn-helix (wHTH) protein